MNGKKKVVMFDLDGTLLPMDLKVFTQSYFGKLAKKMAEFGFDPVVFLENVKKSLYVTIRNTGEASNFQVFWSTFESFYEEDVRKYIPILDDFYRNEFSEVRKDCGFNPLAKKVVDTLKSKDIRVVLATNPLFPETATENRIGWTGLSISDFELVTTYENSCFCKPNPQYYNEILGKLQVAPEDCLMVGNDVYEDGAALKAGIDLFLITDHLLNKYDDDFSHIPHGNYEDLLRFIETI